MRGSDDSRERNVVPSIDTSSNILGFFCPNQLEHKIMRLSFYPKGNIIFRVINSNRYIHFTRDLISLVRIYDTQDLHISRITYGMSKKTGMSFVRRKNDQSMDSSNRCAYSSRISSMVLTFDMYSAIKASIFSRA